jgi:hypothetical protein
VAGPEDALTPSECRVGGVCEMPGAGQSFANGLAWCGWPLLGGL